MYTHIYIYTFSISFVFASLDNKTKMKSVERVNKSRSNLLLLYEGSRRKQVHGSHHGSAVEIGAKQNGCWRIILMASWYDDRTNHDIFSNITIIWKRWTSSNFDRVDIFLKLIPENHNNHRCRKRRRDGNGMHCMRSRADTRLMVHCALPLMSTVLIIAPGN